MTKKQMIIEILSKTNKYNIDQLLKLWYAELKILHHHVTEEKGKTVYGIE
jgi:hypothetical protein